MTSFGVSQAESLLRSLNIRRSRMSRIYPALLMFAVLSCSCSERDDSQRVPQTKIPPEEPYFYVADGALDVYYSGATADPFRPGASVAAYDLSGEFPPTGLLKKIREHLEAQKWREVCMEAPESEAYTGRWKPLQRSGVKGEDQWYTLLYVREQGDSLRIDIFHWKTRTSGPQFKIQMLHTDAAHATDLVDYCRREGILPKSAEVGNAE